MYKSFKDMPIWQNAIEVATIIYTLTERLPKKEDYGFTSQISPIRSISSETESRFTPLDIKVNQQGGLS
ncbi:MAG: four helix bundle protein [Candidatus Cloacimonetes bacterium]|nr:four helix bundle protein [Candidatus Cloacimonadota bacterium]MBL7086600.1 four helix bundle protein [Candidatus Cloacimonadota bacterium]